MPQYKTSLISKNSTLSDAIENMNESGLRAAVVVDENQKLLGLITDYDIRNALTKNIALDTAVEAFMNPKPKTALAGKRQSEYRDLLIEYGNDCLPIVDEQNHVVDLLLLRDFIHRIPLSEPVLEENVWTYMKDALDSGWVSSLGPYVDEFEKRMARYYGVDRTVATASGTAALHIALLIAGVKPGDEVIVPSMTFIATINAIRYVGAVPVFWDSLPDHWNADPSKLEELVTPKTKAIMVVHLYGTPVEMGPVLDVAKKHNLKVIEDAAEALGALWTDESGNTKPCGSIGDIGCLSFNGNKVMTTGSGGLIISKDKDLMQYAHYLVNQAKDDGLTFSHDEIGYNYRLTNLHAALGVAQLESLPGFLEKKRQIARRYEEAFAGHPEIQCFGVPENMESSYWLCGFALNEALLPGRTSIELVRTLDKYQIQTRPFFKPGHLQKPFLQFAKGELPHAEKWQRLGFNLPSSPSLKEEEQEAVIRWVLQVLESWKSAEAGGMIDVEVSRA